MNKFDDLTIALMAAGKELAIGHDWCFDSSSGIGVPPEENNPFITIVRKHIEPIIDAVELRKIRIAALKAELESLESLDN